MTWFQMESEVNDMSPKNDFSDIFDDDFEVTYEEDPEINFHTSEDTLSIICRRTFYEHTVACLAD